MTSTVKLRKPRNATGANRPVGRPKSWTEFNTKFQAMTINIDLTPVPKADEPVKMRERSAFKKVRPASASLLDDPDAMSIHTGAPRPPSPKYKSFMVPNPWRVTSKSPKFSNSRSKSQSGSELDNYKGEKETGYYDEAHANYFATNNAKNAAEDKKIEPASPKAMKLEEAKGSEVKISQFGSFSDTDSLDSAVVVSEGSSARGISSEKSPRWRTESRESDDLESPSSVSHKTSEPTERESDTDTDTPPANKETTQFILSKKLTIVDKGDPQDLFSGNIKTLPAPKIYLSVEKKEKADDTPTMEYYEPEIAPYDVTFNNKRDSQRLDLLPDDEVAGANRSIVPSPLKSCYAPIATYDIPVDEYFDDDSEDESMSEVSRSNVSCHGYEGDKSTEEYASPRPRPTARPRQSSIKSLPKLSPTSRENSEFQARRLKSDETDQKTGNSGKIDLKSGTWPRRRVKKREETVVDTEELMRRFQKTREAHLARFKTIYADSRKKVNDIMRGLERSMTEHGYREWYPRIR